MTPRIECFSRSYGEARSRFLEQATRRGLQVGSHVLPRPGADGETLAMDVAVLDPAGAQALLIVSSACHGIEGYAGSGAQVALLLDDELEAAARERGVAVLFIHALNPHGFSWRSRVTEDNVDLNRNFIDFSRPPPANPDYERIAPLLVPRQWPPPAMNTMRLAAFVARHGMRGCRPRCRAGSTWIRTACSSAAMRRRGAT